MKKSLTKVTFKIPLILLIIVPVTIVSVTLILLYSDGSFFKKVKDWSDCQYMCEYREELLLDSRAERIFELEEEIDKLRDDVIPQSINYCSDSAAKEFIYSGEYLGNRIENENDIALYKEDNCQSSSYTKWFNEDLFEGTEYDSQNFKDWWIRVHYAGGYELIISLIDLRSTTDDEMRKFYVIRYDAEDQSSEILLDWEVYGMQSIENVELLGTKDVDAGLLIDVSNPGIGLTEEESRDPQAVAAFEELGKALCEYGKQGLWVLDLQTLEFVQVIDSQFADCK